MPTYSYRCTECGHAFDIHQEFTDASLTVCPDCGGVLRKVFSPVGISFNGPGFYRTDSRASSESKSGAKAESHSHSHSDSGSGASSGSSDSGKAKSESSGGSGKSPEKTSSKKTSESAAAPSKAAS
ncbi:MAG: FmdB family transcriptional regulator [Cryobacterium sp.]|nr:FmdB family transcriptional regulator [Cryobacterium sp.]MBX3090016.1 FmdB family transcriptional regulator [Cryobacterium sp.]MCO5293392.1 FmdB family transcriptional regulator [Homoserinimonas sp.]MCW5945010.1 FmdB family transcriptional regulator [Cryobacterium sp.]